MNKDFADWYRAAVPNFNDEDLKKRWIGIESFSKQSSIDNWLNVVRLYVDIPPKDDNFVAKFSKAFKDADATFPFKDNTLELRVLAASMILNSFEVESDEADATALAIVTATHFRQSATHPIDSAVTSAVDYLVTEGRRVRRDVKKANIDISKLCVDSELAAAKAGIQQLGDYSVKLVQQLGTTFNGIVGNLQSIYQEESDILWWAFAGHSNDIEVPFSKMGLPASCIIAPSELAVITVRLPGPPSSSAILDKVLRTIEPEHCATVSIADCINATPRDWREQFFKKHEVQLRAVEDLCPLIMAIRKSIENQTDSDWHGAFQFTTKVLATATTSPLALSTQMYNECLLLRTAKNT